VSIGAIHGGGRSIPVRDHYNDVKGSLPGVSSPGHEPVPSVSMIMQAVSSATPAPAAADDTVSGAAAGASAARPAIAASDPDASPGGDGTGLAQYTQALQAFVQWSDRTIVQTATIVPTPNASIEQIVAKTASPD
jgi:hypothetical protein